MLETGTQPSVAYFSMEIALDPSIPTYSGGLGILAGDMLRAAADRGLPLIGVSLVHRAGYFRQHLDAGGNQSDAPDPWDPEAHGLHRISLEASVEIEGRTVRLAAWQFPVQGVDGATLPVLLLDTDLEENDPRDRRLTDQLYGGDERYRLSQEAVLGLGGALALRELGVAGSIGCYHLNEGHNALLVLALLESRLAETGRHTPEREDLDWIRERCVFTTHTPVPAGHDSFSLDLALDVLGARRVELLRMLDGFSGDRLNMTALAQHSARFINGVAMRHGEVLREQMPDTPVHAITNGVHAATWIAAPFAELYTRRLGDWRRDNLVLRQALGIPLDEIVTAHREAKASLLAEVARRGGRGLDPAVFTIGFARRATGYKRADLVFADLERLRALAARAGRIQFVFGGKAHPRDESGKALIRNVFAAAAALGDDVPVAFVENYDMEAAGAICAGVDLWLNNPVPPQEASGTSGMKAALNGVPSLSVLDGWWVEGYIDGLTGWAISSAAADDGDPRRQAAAIYDALETRILPAYYSPEASYAAVMRGAIAHNGSFFNTERMVQQYALDAYRLDPRALFERPPAHR
jgi:starch phosphorylase